MHPFDCLLRDPRHAPVSTNGGLNGFFTVKLLRWPKSKAFHGGLALSTAFGEVDHLKGSRKFGW